MNDKIKENAIRRKDEIINVYNELHKIPELSTQEYKTSKFIKKYLEEYGFEVISGIANTGLVTYIKSNEPGPTLAIRVDIDALEHLIDGKIKMIHSCGHDAHATMGIFSGIVVKELELVKRGTLKLIFQPSEEREETSGARDMVSAGVVDDVDMLIGIHLRPGNEVKLGQAISGLRHSALNTILVKVIGEKTHAGRPHLGKNPIDAIAAIINAVNAIWIDPSIPSSIKLTSVHADGANNSSIPGKGEIGMDLRANTNEAMNDLINKARNAIKYGAATIGCDTDIEIIPGLPAGEIDDYMIRVADESIVEVLGNEGSLGIKNTTGGDDFTIYTNLKPELKNTFIGLGCNLYPGLHDPDMAFAKEALVDGVSILAHMVDKILC